MTDNAQSLIGTGIFRKNVEMNVFVFLFFCLKCCSNFYMTDFWEGNGFHKLPNCFRMWEQTRKIKGNIFVMKVFESCIHMWSRVVFLLGMMTIIMEFYPFLTVVQRGFCRSKS